MAAEFDWKKQLEEAKADLVKRAEALKNAFVQMPGGQPAGDSGAGGAPVDPAAGGMPSDPAMAGGDPSAMAGGAPVDPSMAGVDPAAMAAMAGGMPPMGVDAATAGMLGGMPPVDPAAAGAAGAVAGGAGAGTPEPTLTLSLSQLWDVVKKVLALAKTVGANGQGVPAEGAAPAQPAGMNQDAIKAAVIEALGDMGAMKTAQDNAQRAADEAPIKMGLKSVNAQLNASPKGTTVKFNPRLQKLILAYQQKYGRNALDKLVNVTK